MNSKTEATTCTEQGNIRVIYSRSFHTNDEYYYFEDMGEVFAFVHMIADQVGEPLVGPGYQVRSVNAWLTPGKEREWVELEYCFVDDLHFINIRIPLAVNGECKCVE